MASSSTCLSLKDAGFYIQNIPKDFNEWDLFDVFSQFGPISYCRIGGRMAKKEQQFGFINMLNVADADFIRKRIVNKKLSIRNFSFIISNVYNDTEELAHDKVDELQKDTVISKRVPIGYISFKNDLRVEIVENLANLDGYVVLSIKEDDNSLLDCLYRALNMKLSKYMCQRQNFYKSEIDIGEDCAYQAANEAFLRARRVSEQSLYMVDEGFSVNYDENRVYKLPEYFKTIPTRISPCVLVGVSINSKCTEKVNDFILKWCRKECSSMRIDVHSYSSEFTMIRVKSNNSNLSEELVKASLCSKLEKKEAEMTKKYSRDAMMALCENYENPVIIEKDEQVYNLRKFETIVI